VFNNDLTTSLLASPLDDFSNESPLWVLWTSTGLAENW